MLEPANVARMSVELSTKALVSVTESSLALLRFEFEIDAASRFAPVSTAACISTLLKFAWLRLAPLKLTARKMALVAETESSLAPFNDALNRTAPDSLAPV